jgi:hypothetical protein
MTRRTAIALVAGWLVAAAAPGTALAHPGHDHKVLGNVTMAAADHLMVKDRQGKDHTIQITSATKVLRDKKPVRVEEIKDGMRVVVTAVTENDKLVAKTIELGSAPTTKQ